jgi:hypothetical protein
MLVGLVVLAVAAFGAGTASAATLTADNFEDGNAAGWTTTGGTWAVAQESSKVLRQSSLAANAVARTGSLSWQNYTVKADVKPSSYNGMPGFAGIVARAQSSSTYYALVLRPDDSVALIRSINGESSTLSSAPLAVSAGTTYTLSLRVAGQSLTGQVNGVRVTASDAFNLTAGPAGLVTTWTMTSFDNVSVNTD